MREVLKRHDRYITSVVSTFEDKLDPILDRARKNTLKVLEARLTLGDGGLIEATPGNARALRLLDKIFEREMERAGYETLVKAFTDQFAGDHLPVFQDVLADLNVPAVTLTAADAGMLASQALSARAQLLDVVSTAAIGAKRQALFGMAGMKFSDLVETLATRYEKTRAEARTLADTSTTVFWRTLADQTFRKIEEDHPTTLKYLYAGPDDAKTRPFCDDLIRKMQSGGLTRKEIDELDNGQTPNVFTTAGGFNCRHVWILDTTKLKGN